MHITLQKREKGQTWASPILGQGQLDPYAPDLEQKRLMLQRFQEEVSYSKHSSCFCIFFFLIESHLGQKYNYAAKDDLIWLCKV